MYDDSRRVVFAPSFAGVRMSDRLAVIQHHPVEGVGGIGDWAARRGIVLDVCRGDLGDLPVDPAACILLGGPESVLAPTDWLRGEQRWLRDCIADGTRFLGICLGAQLLADALGAVVAPLGHDETGWTPIECADGARRWFLEWHSDGFALPPGARELARGADGACQCFAVGGHVGMQFHPEWNAALVRQINLHFADGSALPRDADPARFAGAEAWLTSMLDDWWDRRG